MRRVLLIVLLVLAGLGMARWAIAPNSPAPVETAVTPSPIDEAPEARAPDEGSAVAPTGRTRRATASAGDAEASQALAPFSRYTSTIDTDVFVDEWLSQRYQAVFNGEPEDYERRLAAAEAGDADAAFDVYMLVNRCLDSPHTEWQLQQSVERLESRLLQMPEHSEGDAEQLLNRIDAVHRAQDFCAVLDGANVDLVAEGLRWLNRAADLGHMGAQRIYHAHARDLIAGQDGSLAFRQPGLIEEYKSRCDQYVRALLDAGHPQGLSLMSRMLTIGDVYERDPISAWAYARALERVGDGRLVAEAQARMNWVSRYVPPEDQREAESIADDIVDAWRERERERRR
ncbi:MAG: hypothetical protein AAGE01_21070 [Pseudomonadota bacterium]